MKRLLTIILSVVMSPSVAFSSYEAEIGGVLQDVSSTNRMVRLNVTNRIDALMLSLSNREEIAVCRLLKAKVRMECVDIMEDDTIYDPLAYHDVTNLCWNVLRDFDAERTAWPFYGASLLLPLPLSIEKRYDDMFLVATNALSSINSQNEILVDTNVWNVLFGQELLCPSNMSVSFRTIAASSLLMSDATADVSSYTNGLPPAAASIINATLSNH